MSAATPLPASTMDKKPNEPSMEEILASIRRIIADDQSLPGHGAVSSPLRAPAAPADAPMPPLSPAPIPEYRDPPVDAGPLVLDSLGGPEALEDRHDAVRQHGSIAAPQFPTPNGRVEEAHRAEVDAHHDWSATPVSRRIEPVGEPQFVEPDMPELPRERHADLADSHSVHAEAVAKAPPAPSPPVYATPDEAAFAEPDDDEHPYDEPLAAPLGQKSHGAAGLFSAATDTSITSAFNMLAASRLADNSDELMNMVREMIRPLLRSWLDDNLPSMVERMVRAEIERVARGGR